MANATIQFTQGATVVPPGQSAVGFDKTTTVTLTDAAGGGAISYSWSIVSFPGPLSAAPTINTPSQQIATVTGPFVDGVYIVKLIRVDGTGTTVDIKFFGVADENGLHLPSAGMTGTMSNVGGAAASQAAGWAGRASAYNVFLDAYLRWLKSRVGASGKVTTGAVSNATSSPALFANIDGVGIYELAYSKTSAAHTIQLSNTGANFPGETMEFIVSMQAATQSLSFQSGTSGPIVTTLTSPPTGAGTLPWHLRFVRGPSEWELAGIEILDKRTLRTSHEVQVVAGIQSVSTDTFTRVAAFQLDPSVFPTAQIKLKAILEATTAQTAECRLYNVTDGGPVAGSLLTGTTEDPAVYEATVTLPNSEKLYEVQLRLGAPNGGTDRAACTSAKVLLTWG